MNDELSDQLVARNEQLLEQDKFEEAGEIANEVMELNPEDALALYVMGRSLYMEKKFEDALAYLSKSVEIDNTKTDTWTLIGLSLIALGRVEESLESLEYVAKTEPNNLLAKYGLGLAYIMLNKKGSKKLLVEVAKEDKKRFIEYTDQIYKRLIEPNKNISSTDKSVLERYVEGLKMGPVW